MMTMNNESPCAHSPLWKYALPIYIPSVIYSAGRGAVNPVLALAALTVGFSSAGSSAVVGIFGAVGVLLSPLIGRFINRIGDRASLISGSIISAAALVLSFVALALGKHFMARILLVLIVFMLAIGANIWALARQTYMAENVPAAYRARALSTFGGMTRIGNLLGPLLATGALTLWTLRSVFIVQLVCVIVSLAFIVAFMTPQTPPEESKDSQALLANNHADSISQSNESITNTAQHRSAASIESFYVQKETSKFALLVMGIGMNALTVLRANRNVIVPLWGTFLGLPEHFITATFAVTALLDAAMFAFSGILMDKRGRIWAIIPSLTIMPLAIIIMIAWRSPIGFVVGSALLGFGNGFGSGIIMTTGADLAPSKNKASFLGVWQAIVAVGTACGPFIISGLTAVASLAVGLGATAAIGIFGALWCALLTKPAYEHLGIDLRGEPLPRGAS